MDANGGPLSSQPLTQSRTPWHPYTHPVLLSLCLSNLNTSLLHLRCRALSTVVTMLTCHPDAGSCATRPSIAPTAGPSRLHRLPCMQTWDPVSDPSRRLIIRTLCGTVHPPTYCLFGVRKPTARGTSSPLLASVVVRDHLFIIAPSFGATSVVLTRAAGRGGSDAGLYHPQ